MKYTREAILHRWLNWLTTSLRLQLLLAVAVLPFLLWWHLPFTPVSLIGNLIHPLFLVPFLGVSSLLFFATLLGLPTGILCTALVCIHRCWHTVLHLHTRPWWVQITWWHLLPALGIGAALWVYGYTQYSYGYKKKIITYLLAASLLGALIAWLAHQPAGVTTLHRNNYWLTFTPHADHLALHDHGYISRAGNLDALVDYEIMPHIITHYGQPTRIKIHAHHYGRRVQTVKKLLHAWGC